MAMVDKVVDNVSEKERRRYFRIEDLMAIRYEALTVSEALQREQQMQSTDYLPPNHLQVVERQLQLLIDKLRVQNPEVAGAIDLLNQKFNLLKDRNVDDFIASGVSSGATAEFQSGIPKGNVRLRRQVNISACGVSFEDAQRQDIGQHLLLDITLLPSDLQVTTLGVVIGCHHVLNDEWTVRVEFYGMNSEDEELLVQHIVKRQGRLLAARREKRDDL
ncbi:MAG: hypothetical protein ACI8PP_000348 [Candidatus Pseudothioglobus sp.]|jgi:hypothetical protein